MVWQPRVPLRPGAARRRVGLVRAAGSAGRRGLGLARRRHAHSAARFARHVPTAPRPPRKPPGRALDLVAIGFHKPKKFYGHTITNKEQLLSLSAAFVARYREVEGLGDEPVLPPAARRRGRWASRGASAARARPRAAAAPRAAARAAAAARRRRPPRRAAAEAAATAAAPPLNRTGRSRPRRRPRRCGRRTGGRSTARASAASCSRSRATPRTSRGARSRSRGSRCSWACCTSTCRWTRAACAGA